MTLIAAEDTGEVCRGDRRRITKQEAAIKQLANKAASGDKRAIQDMFRFQTMSRAETHR